MINLLPSSSSRESRNCSSLTDPNPSPFTSDHRLAKPRFLCCCNGNLRFDAVCMATQQIPLRRSLSFQKFRFVSSSGFHDTFPSPLYFLETRRDRTQPQAALEEDYAMLDDILDARNLLLHSMNVTVTPVLETELRSAIIDGKAIAETIEQELATETADFKSKTGKSPGLAVILVGSRIDSETYVQSKKKGCKDVGIGYFERVLPEDSSEEEVLNVVKEFNEDPSVHGILVQLPLPKHMNEERVLATVSAEKDVDGFHPLNIGKLAMQGRTPLFVSCTPKGCIELLRRSNIDIKGQHVVVIGQSNIVATPVAMLLQRHQATVTVVHSHTPNPAQVTSRADIVVAAAGVAELVRADWIKPGAVVIDVGINAVQDPSAKKGYRLVGDVCFEEVSRVAAVIAQVPGGVGPMAIAMLLSNTLDSAKRSYGLLD